MKRYLQTAAMILSVMVPSLLAQSDRKHNVADPSPERMALPFSDSVLVGNTLYLSGHIGTDPKTGAVPASPKDETRFLLDEIKRDLELEGASMDDLVMVQVFTTDLGLFDDFNSVYRTYFHGSYPSRAFVGSTKLLFGAHFEITGIAVKRTK
jgi:2-iminobutanoate/2-iminopropanoate deaminase